MGKAVALHPLFSRASLLLFIKILLSLTILVYGASIVALPTSYKAVSAGRISVNATLAGMDRGFSKAPLTIPPLGTGCAGTQVIYSVVAGTANAAITAGDIVYDLQVNTTASTPVSSCWKVSLFYTPAGGSQISAGSVYIGTTVTVSSGQTIDCKFDLGASLPTPPFTFQVSVA